MQRQHFRDRKHNLEAEEEDDMFSLPVTSSSQAASSGITELEVPTGASAETRSHRSGRCPQQE